MLLLALEGFAAFQARGGALAAPGAFAVPRGGPGGPDPEAVVQAVYRRPAEAPVLACAVQPVPSVRGAGVWVVCAVCEAAYDEVWPESFCSCVEAAPVAAITRVGRAPRETRPAAAPATPRRPAAPKRPAVKATPARACSECSTSLTGRGNALTCSPFCRNRRSRRRRRSVT